MALVFVWLSAAVFVISMVKEYARVDGWGIDSHAYWLTGHRSQLYGLAPGRNDAYLYSPAFATLIWPLTQLPWTAFMVLWTSIELAVFVWLLAPLGWKWALPLVALCGLEALAGDIFGLLALAMVVGMRSPSAWSFPALTKIAPCLGPVWFAVRGDWARLGAALGTTATITAASLAVTPGRWIQWVEFLVAHRGDGYYHFPLRLVAALILTVFGARKNRPWLLAPAVFLALPVWSNPWIFTVFAALPRLRPAAPRP